MAKRTATSELNHDNWNEEEAPEEAGTFRKATSDVMQNRVVKAAKRRSMTTPENSLASKSPFSAFGGFKVTSSNTSSTFSFLSVTKPTTDVMKDNKNDTSNGKTEEVQSSNNHSPEYYSSLKGLNQSVSQWIKSHVDSNPFCILTPIFKDYAKHLAEIDEKEAKKSKSKLTEKSIPTSTMTSTSTESTSKPEEENSRKDVTNSFAFSTSTPPKFNFGSGTSNSTMSAGFTFAGSQPFFTFSNVTKQDEKKTSVEEEEGNGEENEGPPKVEFKPVVEEGAVYNKRCKVFVKKDSDFQDRGVGTLYLKPVGEKTQLIVRAETSLGNVILNTLLKTGMPLQRMGPNNVLIACIPTPDAQPPPVPVLLRLKTGAEADETFEKMKQYMK